MPRHPFSTNEQIAIEIRKGTSTRDVSTLCRCSMKRVSKIRQQLLAAGENIVLKDKRYKKYKPDNLYLFKIKEGRNHKEGWIDYMKKNPFYFKSTFDLDPTDRNIIDIAENDTTVSACLALGA